MGLSNTYVIHAQETKETIAERIMELYKEAMVTQDAEWILERVDELSVEDNVFRAFFDWRLTLMSVLEVGYFEFEYNITDVEVEYQQDSILLEIIFDEEHQYNNGAGEGASSGIVLGVRIDDMINDFSISDIYMENDEFYTYFTEHMQELNTYGLRERTIEEITESLIDELYYLRDEMLEVEAEQIAGVRPGGADIQPYASTYSYSGYTGAAYANTFYSTPNSYFYTASYDCTNFVSQCVWAAYGGWYSSISDATLASNISNKVRMTSSWYAGSGGGSSSWENVDNLWNYVVGNTGNGPKAYGYNNGNHYSFIEPVDIAVGDVLQKSSSGSDYYHSLYVVSVPGGSNPSYSEIVLAQHTGNKKITLAETISLGGTYIRQMQFTSNTFDK